MNHRTRYFFVGSALVIVVGLCTGLVAYYNGNLPLRSSSIGPAELAYIPSDTTAVAYADVNRIMNSEFRQKLRALLPTGNDKDRLLAETGIDIEKDIDSAVAGMSSSGAGPAGFLVLLRGRFNDVQIESVAVQHGAAVEQYNGKRLLIASAPAGATSPADGAAVSSMPKSGGIAFLEPGLVALGETASLHRAIDAAASRQGVTGNAELMRFVAEVQGEGNCWVVGRFSALAGARGMPAQMRDQMPAVEWFAASADVDHTVSARLHAETKDDASGEQLRAIVNGAVAAARMMSGTDARMQAAVNSVQSSGAGKSVEISMTVPVELLDTLHGGTSGMSSSPVSPR